MNWTPAKMGKKGGAAKGPTKKRGDSEYYKRIREIREEKRRAKTTAINSANAAVLPRAK